MAKAPTVTTDNPETQGSDADERVAGSGGSDVMDSVSPSVPLANIVPSKGTKVIKFESINNRPGYSGSSYVITSAQLREVGIDKPFTNEAQTEASFNKLNGYMVPVSVFSDKAVERLVKEPDLSVTESPGA
jgi:hypothetical protein